MSTASSLRDQRCLVLSAFAHSKTWLFHTIVMMQSTCHHHLAVRCTLVLTTSPDVLPWLRFCFRGWISVSPNTAEEIFAGDSLHGFFIMRSHYDSGQRCQAFWGGGEGGGLSNFLMRRTDFGRARVCGGIWRMGCI